MANLGCLFECTFGNFLAFIVVATHIFKNLDFRNENEGYESD